MFALSDIKLLFNHIDINKTSVCFTWDDNFIAHERLIAPQFLKRGMRCTFYINPGEPGFKENYSDSYKALSECGFEIGSHGFFHHDFSVMPPSELEYELARSVSGVSDKLGIYPSTFAFPYHAFNDDTLQAARKFYLETRNTLKNAVRFGIRTNSALDEMLLCVKTCISNKRSLVFSGHSAIPDTDTDFTEDTGHEPVPLQTLSSLLDCLLTIQDSAEVLTFEQAALKQYIIDNCEVSGGSYILSGGQADWLNTFGIDTEKLSALI